MEVDWSESKCEERHDSPNHGKDRKKSGRGKRKTTEAKSERGLEEAAMTTIVIRIGAEMANLERKTTIEREIGKRSERGEKDRKDRGKEKERERPREKEREKHKEKSREKERDLNQDNKEKSRDRASKRIVNEEDHRIEDSGIKQDESEKANDGLANVARPTTSELEERIMKSSCRG